jgi:hypothetical protein
MWSSDQQASFKRPVRKRPCNTGQLASQHARHVGCTPQVLQVDNTMQLPLLPAIVELISPLPLLLFLLHELT